MTLLTSKTALACALATACATVVAAPARDCIDLKGGATGRLELVRGKSMLKRFCSPASQVTVGAPEVANVVVPNASEIVLVARSVGSTNLIVANKEGHSTVFDIEVKLDTAALREQFAQLFPTEKDLRVGSSGNAVVLSGMVSDSVVAAQLVALATSFQDSATAAASAGAGTPPASGVGQPAAAAAPAAPAAAAAPAAPAAAKVMNMLQVAAPQQVMLEVKIAEISKSLVDQLGASLSRVSQGSSGTYGIVSSLLSGGGGSLGVLANSVGRVTIDGEKRDGLVKILAEPTVMAISGQEASFLAGGKIFIPVAQNSLSSGGAITLEEKEYGVAVKFTPTVLAGGRINLRVAPEVSELNREGIGIATTGGTNAATAILPAFTTRRATTTVQLQDGQSFAIGGLIRNNVTSNIKRFPFLGDVPVLGTLFRSSDFQNDRTELVFIVTPHLAKPLQDKPRLPTDGYIQPTPGTFFIGGSHEGFEQSDPKKTKP
ncbi:type II and III secretion system protein family protein [Massilia sp. YMA4]|uniref:type II and III secretion system protein family protein n=1 Tax=Massilia sp. YMA4 TaxID=1593482 RepID=UPI000DD11501|nr:type II and III secretion system protein family protein [Massilia sp. YMA4]AXA93282.1 type II and III secretion system protein family protein [Massilia sp. YMA4]